MMYCAWKKNAFELRLSPHYTMDKVQKPIFSVFSCLVVFFISATLLLRLLHTPAFLR
jgi:hypothetical protein